MKREYKKIVRMKLKVNFQLKDKMIWNLIRISYYHQLLLRKRHMKDKNIVLQLILLNKMILIKIVMKMMICLSKVNYKLKINLQ